MNETGPVSQLADDAEVSAQRGEIWIETFKVRVGRTVVTIERQALSGVDGDREQDRWLVVAPRWADHIGDDRWFEDHVSAQQFAGYMAEMLDKQRATWDDAMRTIRREWLWHLAATPDGRSDERN